MTNHGAALNRQLFEANPTLYLENALKQYVAAGSSNRLQTGNSSPIFDEPLVGFADGDDPIFQDYKTIIGDFHLTPRQVLEKHLDGSGCEKAEQPARVSIMSWTLPVTCETRHSLRRESLVPCLSWNYTRWHGQDFIDELARHMVDLLQHLGHRAIAPELADCYEIRNLANGFASNWSQRHIAYAAGLGTFSLSDGFITPRGIAMRCGSVVCDAALSASPREYGSHLANCLFYTDGSCRRCIERCPAGAISEQGHDKKRCAEYLLVEQKAILKQLGRDDGYIGRYPGCGLCQTNVPCEAGIPPGPSNQAP